MITIYLRLLRNFLVDCKNSYSEGGSHSISRLSVDALFDHFKFNFRFYMLLRSYRRQLRFGQVSEETYDPKWQTIMYELHRILELYSGLTKFNAVLNMEKLSLVEEYVGSLFGQVMKQQGPTMAWKQMELVEAEVEKDGRAREEVAIYKFLAEKGYKKSEPDTEPTAKIVNEDKDNVVLLPSVKPLTANEPNSKPTLKANPTTTESATKPTVNNVTEAKTAPVTLETSNDGDIIAQIMKMQTEMAKSQAAINELLKKVAQNGK